MNLNPPRNKKTALKSPVFLNHNNPKAVLLKGKMGGSILDLAVPHRIHGWLVARCLVWAAALMEMKLPCPQGGWQGWEGELLHLLDISRPWMTTLIQMMSFPPSASLKHSESGRCHLKGTFFCCLSSWRKPTVRFISHLNTLKMAKMSLFYRPFPTAAEAAEGCVAFSWHWMGSTINNPGVSWANGPHGKGLG